MAPPVYSVGQLTVPAFLYGTAWKEHDTERCVMDAVNAGFRGIDTANQRKHYFEAGVGNALVKIYERSGLGRGDLFLQTKFTFLDGQDQRLPYDPRADYSTQVQQSFASSLEHLHTDYIDSYILHGPSTGSGLAAADWEVWRAIERLQQSGKIKLIGVSNVSTAQLELLLKDCKVKPAFVQNRCFARTGWDRHTRGLCRQHQILYQGFSLLTANPHIFEDPRFTAIIREHHCSPAQLVFSFALQVGMMPITGTTDPVHMWEDLAALNLKLSQDQIALLESIALN